MGATSFPKTLEGKLALHNAQTVALAWRQASVPSPASCSTACHCRDCAGQTGGRLQTWHINKMRLNFGGAIRQTKSTSRVGKGRPELVMSGEGALPPGQAANRANQRKGQHCNATEDLGTASGANECRALDIAC